MNRLQNALKLRQQFYSKPFYRLIHSEADELPGLIIDRFDEVFIGELLGPKGPSFWDRSQKFLLRS